MTRRVRCDGCRVLVINGRPCHETGCPNGHVDPATGEPYPAECAWCGQDCDRARNQKAFCGDDCRAAYYDLPADGEWASDRDQD
jgi:hypothetical protein